MDVTLGEEVVLDFKSREGLRGVWESYWDDIADYVEPNMRDMFRRGDYRTPGERLTDKQLDSFPTIALTRFAAILDSLLTPRNETWHRLVPSDAELMKDNDVRLYFEQATRALFRHRYAPPANFSINNQLVFRGLGAFGTAAMFTDKLAAGKGVRYKSIHVGQMFPKENHQGLIDDIIRLEKFRAHQLVKVTEWADVLPDTVKQAASTPATANREFSVLHRVRPRPDIDYEALDETAMPYESVYVLMEGAVVLASGGYRTFPYAATRYDQSPNEVYGRSPAMQCFPAVKSLNVAKRVLLTQGHRAMNPVLLVHDDGSINAINLRPGSVIPGSMSSEGRPLVGTLPTGEHAIGKDMIDGERADISAAFLVELFQILQDTPRMTATEVLERAREKGMLLAPTIGRQQSEYLGPLIEREVDLLAQQGLLPPPPPALREAKGEYEVMYDSPLSRAARSGEAAGFNRVMEMLIAPLNAGQVGILDNFDWDTITRELADIQAVPASWMKAPKIVEAQRAARAEQEQSLLSAQLAPDQLRGVAAAKKAGVTSKDLQ
jgi:hypothetical protein